MQIIEIYSCDLPLQPVCKGFGCHSPLLVHVIVLGPVSTRSVPEESLHIKMTLVPTSATSLRSSGNKVNFLL